MDADRQVDQVAIAIGIVADDREILFFDSPLLKLIGQSKMGTIGLGDDKHAARVAIEPVDDPRSRGAAGATEPVEMELQGAGKRAGPVPLRRMHDHAGRFVDRREPVVLVENIERDILRLRRFAGDFGKRETDLLVEPQAMGGLCTAAIDLDGGRVDCAAKLNAAMRRELARQE